jgi:AraC-like DNA-binding protein
MISEYKAPSFKLKDHVECFWLIAFDKPPHPQKIIPDGFPELIFHFKDDYQINLNGIWETQTKSLVAGQIRKYFYLKNTGETRMFGIKFKPAAIRHLFGLHMHALTDRVVDLCSFNNQKLLDLEAVVRQNEDFEKLVIEVEALLIKLVGDQFEFNSVDKAIEIILKSKGNVDVSQICESMQISERHLERLFKDYVGLPPKFYGRVIRFSNIFKLVESNDPSWSDLVYNTGFYDQSHFIRNFKAFTGEDPSAYLFAAPTIANFFLRK